MRNKLDFLYDLDDRKFEIIAILDGLLPIGNYGYNVKVLEAYIHPERKTIAEFTIDYNGQIFIKEGKQNENYNLCVNIANRVLSLAKESEDFFINFCE